MSQSQGYGSQSPSSAKRSRKSYTPRKTKLSRTKPYSAKVSTVAVPSASRIIQPTFQRQRTRFHVLRYATLLTQTTGTVTNDPNPKYGALSFKMSDFVDYLAFMSNYDSFCFKWIKVTFTRLQQAADDATAGDCTAILHVVPDFDDDVTPSAVDQIRVRPYYKMIPISDSQTPVSMTIKPKCTNIVTQGFASTSLAAQTSANDTWLNTTTDGAAVKHYGFKYAIEQYIAAALSSGSNYTDLGIHMTVEAGVLGRGETKF